MLQKLRQEVQKLKFAIQHKYHFLEICNFLMNRQVLMQLLLIYDQQAPDNKGYQIKLKLAIEVKPAPPPEIAENVLEKKDIKNIEILL